MPGPARKVSSFLSRTRLQISSVRKCHARQTSCGKLASVQGNRAWDEIGGTVVRRWVIEFVLIFAACLAGSAQVRSAGELHVTATVVSSSALVQQPDGTFRLVVANSPSQSDARDLGLATENQSVVCVTMSDTAAKASPRSSSASVATRHHRKNRSLQHQIDVPDISRGGRNRYILTDEK